MRQPALDDQQIKTVKELAADAAKLARRRRAKTPKSSASDITMLLDELREAMKLYTDTGDQGRAGALWALRAVHKFLLVLSIERREDFTAPIAGLIAALGDVERGIKNPLFIPKEPSRDAPTSWHRIRALAAFTSVALSEMGGTATAADEAAVQVLTKLGFKKKRWNYGDQVNQDDEQANQEDNEHAADITVRTIRQWRTEISQDSGRERFETQLFYLFKDEWSRFPERRRTREHLMQVLEMMAKRLRPTA